VDANGWARGYTDCGADATGAPRLAKIGSMWAPPNQGTGLDGTAAPATSQPGR
jgi:hypothetical protein